MVNKKYVFLILYFYVTNVLSYHIVIITPVSFLFNVQRSLHQTDTDAIYHSVANHDMTRQCKQQNKENKCESTNLAYRHVTKLCTIQAIF